MGPSAPRHKAHETATSTHAPLQLKHPPRTWYPGTNSVVSLTQVTLSLAACTCSSARLRYRAEDTLYSAGLIRGRSWFGNNGSLVVNLAPTGRTYVYTKASVGHSVAPTWGAIVLAGYGRVRGREQGRQAACSATRHTHARFHALAHALQQRGGVMEAVAKVLHPPPGPRVKGHGGGGSDGARPDRGGGGSLHAVPTYLTPSVFHMDWGTPARLFSVRCSRNMSSWAPMHRFSYTHTSMYAPSMKHCTVVSWKSLSGSGSSTRCLVAGGTVALPPAPVALSAVLARWTARTDTRKRSNAPSTHPQPRHSCACCTE